MNVSVDSTLHQLIMGYAAAVSTLQQVVAERDALAQQLKEPQAATVRSEVDGLKAENAALKLALETVRHQMALVDGRKGQVAVPPHSDK